MANHQYFKIGKVLRVKDQKGVERKKLKLGQEGSNDPKYDYTVQVRILKGSPRTKEEIKAAEVVGVFTNPWVEITKPHPKAPESVISTLEIFQKEII